MNRRDFLKGLLTYTAATALGSMAAQLGGPAAASGPRGYLPFETIGRIITAFKGFPARDDVVVDASPYLFAGFGGIESRQVRDSELMPYDAT